MDITAERILFLIGVHGITANKLTTELQIANSAVSEWKKGKARPTSETVARIARYFGVTSDYLLGLTDNPLKEEGSALPAEDMVVIYREGEKLEYPLSKIKLRYVEKFVRELTLKERETEFRI